MPAWSLTVAATKVTAQLLPWRTKPPAFRGPNLFWILDNSSYKEMFGSGYYCTQPPSDCVLSHNTTASYFTTHALWSQDIPNSALRASATAFYSLSPLHPLLPPSSSSTFSPTPSSSSTISSSFNLSSKITYAHALHIPHPPWGSQFLWYWKELRLWVVFTV